MLITETSGNNSMKQLFVFILVLCIFFLVSCTIVDDMNDNSKEDDQTGEVEETPGEGEETPSEGESDNNSGSTGWLPWV